MAPDPLPSPSRTKGPLDARVLHVGWGLLVFPLAVAGFVSGDEVFAGAMLVALAFSLLYRIIVAVERQP